MTQNCDVYGSPTPRCSRRRSERDIAYVRMCVCVAFFEALDGAAEPHYNAPLEKSGYATVAQLVEQLIRNQQVGSSNLLSGSGRQAQVCRPFFVLQPR